jgi:membrane-bound ClpP family serine protease
VVGFGLLLIELLLPTGGLLAALGVAGLTVAGVIALGSDSETADWVGGALIALGIVSAITFYFITRKVIAAHR